MADDNHKTAAQLRKLGERVRAGWAKLHPVSDKHLAAVRTALSEQWKQEHGAHQATKPRRATQQRHQTGLSQSPAKSKSRDHGHSH